MKTILLTLICLSVVLFAACGNTQNIINSTPDDIPADTSSAPDVSADNSESSDVVSEDASEDVSDEVSNDVSDDVSNDTSAPVEHTHTYTVTDSKDATCTEKGYVVKTCTCGDENREEVAALGHESGKWIVITEATTEIKGIKRKYCERCDEMLDEKTIPRLEEDTSFDPNVSEPQVHAFKTTHVAPTCIEEGYSIDECSCCGVYSKYNIVDALGHKKSSPWVTVTEATTSAPGRKEQKCTRCGEIMDWEEIPQLGKYDVIATESNMHLVEERILYYINEYRTSEGACAMTLTNEYDANGNPTNKSGKFARGRALQLVTNYAHDTNDIRSLATELEFGDYVPEHPETKLDPETFDVIYTGNMIPAYYQPPGSEAIGSFVFGEGQTVDRLAKYIAREFHESSAHWDYIGRDANGYIAIGVKFTSSGCFVCLFAMVSNEYD